LQLPVSAVLTRICRWRGYLLVLVFAAPAASMAQTPELEADTDVATAGYYQLRWSADRPIVLEESGTTDFESPKVVYRGSDAARVMSGKADGDLYYRVRDTKTGAQSNIVKVTIRHHGLDRAFAFFALGATVFVATLLLIVAGARPETGR
jgi:hypothetical protein